MSARPEDVIARYATVGGATVDLSHVGPVGDRLTKAQCTGCSAVTERRWALMLWGRQGHTWEVQNRDHGDREARDWAQQHAEVCRALPRPGRS